MDNTERRRIWLCADDYGISPSVNTAIRDLVARGRINATSVMVVAPSFHRSEAKALDILNTGETRVAIGLHATFTAPFSPLTSQFKPLREGRFLPLLRLGTRAFLHRLDVVALVEEVGAQLRRFIDVFGRPPAFIDGHQHAHLFPQIRQAVLEVAARKAPAAWVRQCGSPFRPTERLGDRKGLVLDLLSRTFRRRADALGVVTNPAFSGAYEFVDRAVFAELFPHFLDRLPDKGVVMCHPGFVDAELRRLDPLTTLREQEYAYFAGDAFPDVLASRGFALA
jgi:chitin disaccharide deacetylase